MNNRIIELFKNKKKDVLTIYFTAGFPALQDTTRILKALEKAGVDMIEIGIPYSDPLADGPVIQESGAKALENGMSIKVLFEQLKDIRKEVSLPILFMGYFNPILQYGVENFCAKSNEIGIDGLIVPDLPMYQYKEEYKNVFDVNNLSNVFLVTPQTSNERLKVIDELASGFIYVVSTNSTTGNNAKKIEDNQAYFERIQQVNLKNPTLIGFNVKDNASFQNASTYSNGAIIGSAFIKAIENSTDLEGDIEKFVKGIRT